jgi:hypothetical protein
LSIGLPDTDRLSGFISPGYSSIVQSARREAKEMSFNEGDPKTTRKNSSSIPLSPGRKRNSHALLYGKNQRSRVRL